MEISINLEELRENTSLFIATPMYGSMCFGTYTKSIADLSAMCNQYGIPVKFYYIFNESLITRARNYLADEFMRSTYTAPDGEEKNFTHMMFIDSDIGFNAQDILVMLALSHQNDDYDIVCGPYPKKTIAWEKIKQAVDMGFADQNPGVLERFVGDYVFNPVAGTTKIELDAPVQVLESGTGFMMIKRSVFNEMEKAFPEYLYYPDHVRNKNFDGSRKIMAHFQDPIVNDRFLSEDYFFCQKVAEIGLKTWLLPWVQLTHFGSYMFGGSLSDIAQIGANATADVDLVKNMKK